MLGDEQPNTGTNTCQGAEVGDAHLRTGINLQWLRQVKYARGERMGGKDGRRGQFMKNFKPKTVGLDFPEANRQ